ncbi:MAG TPA: aldehyde dehydrogenase family protein, partial [Bacteroidetes bacterium]|nr:aldehyde dehydrogenase family protein [Bacteroidota bacterium]
QVYRFAIPTLLAGNTVFLKHAPNVPLSAFEIEKSFNEVTGIEGLFQNLFIDIPQVALVMEHPFVQGVSLTGSDRAGKSIGALAGKNIKRSVLELGGNDPFILLRDADMDKAIEHFVLSRMSNNGQICIAAKRMLVHSDIYDEVKKRLVERISALKIGDPMDMESDITCLARPDLRQNLNEQIKDIRALGANVLFENTDLSGNRCSPVVMEIDRNINFKFDNEIFGPVAVMIKFSDDKELLEIANSSKYGLAASIWSKNIEKAENLAASLDVGNVSINKLVASDPRIPFGGTKQSGYGREMAEEGIKEFVNVKAIVVA